ncbi:hypothetical protein [Streptomyces violens]|uniref:hypothetical protein n=1 Tax=Streptomyces violens TaxID=66377 RepID=UPI000ABA0C0F|nr:hypothetical protein [Streptomyces violens]
MTVFAVGALAGSLLLAHRKPAFPPQRRVTYSLVGTGLAETGAATALPDPVLLLIIAALQLCAAAAYIVMRSRTPVAPRSTVPGGPTPRAVREWGRSE